MKQLKAFVTGATGFAGSHLCALLLEKGYEVYALYRSEERIAQNTAILKSQGTPIELMTQQLKWVKGHLNDGSSYEHVLDSDTIVFHTAGLVSFDGTKSKSLYETNVLGTRELVNYCLQKSVQCLLHYSSTSATGKTSNEDELINEHTPLDRDLRMSAYGKTKYLAELELHRGIAEGLHAVIINPGVILGYGNWYEGTTALFRLVYKNLPFYSNGKNGFIGVRDVSIAAELLAHKGECGERYLLVSENLEFRAVFDLMARAMKKRGPYIRIPNSFALFLGKTGDLIKKLGIPFPLSADYTRSSIARHGYSSIKYLNMSGLNLQPMREVIDQTSALLHQEHQSSK